ncbi:hypothetical protein WJX72_005769 [[Myrmecia] bisecta]|uniref:Flavanone 4-reductase n=1 Tax=[Myrmecia] bisecta TaxID=41462 RepID=A0AAW1R6P4_9CHLO
MSGTVCVTGASGFVATELVKQLLERGYTVRGTVRSVHNKEKVHHLELLGKALPGTLELVEADLLKEGSFDEILQGCKYVFHTASPFFIESSNPQKELVDPAVQGTINVLNSAANAKDSVQRVVLTSTVAAVHGEYLAPPKNGRLYTEEDWNETSNVENQAYHVGKTQAERAAWELAKTHDLDLVTILPNFVLGPVISRRSDSTSVKFTKGWLEGNAGSFAPCICDVRDVARAHILAAEIPAASGRYIVSTESEVSPAFIGEVFNVRFPQYDIPEGESMPTRKRMDNTKVTKELGIHLTPTDQTLADMAGSLIALGLATPSESKSVINHVQDKLGAVQGGIQTALDAAPDVGTRDGAAPI